MITYKDYFKILEEIRIDKRLSVEDLCDDVISVRTYYRYLNNETPIKMNIFANLMNRLDLNLSSITLYGIHFRGEDSGVTRFISRVHNKSYHDMDPIYKRVLKIVDDESLSYLCLRSFIIKYEFDNKIIDKVKYYEETINLINKIKDKSITDILLVPIYLNLLEIIPVNEYINIIDLSKLLLKIDFKINVMHYFISIERLLFVMVENNIHEAEYYLLLKHAESIFGYFQTRDIAKNQCLFKAYLYKLNNEINNMNNELFKYLTLVINMDGDNKFLNAVNNVKEVFDVDFKELLINNTSKYKHINLI